MLTNQTSGKVLDVFNASTSNGAAIKQYGYVGGLNQQWQLTLVSAARTPDASPAATAASAAASAEATLLVYPNPNHGDATLAVEAKEAQRVTVYVHNQHGKLVSLFTVPCPAGHSDFHLPTPLPQGTYHVQARVDNQPQHFTLQVE